MAVSMTRKERLARAARGQDVDRVPSIGGWMNGAANLANLAGISAEEYLADPLAGVMKANRRLDVDGMVGPAVPKTLEEVRGGHYTEGEHAEREPEALKELADRTPDTAAELLADYDPAADEQRYRKHFEERLRNQGDIVVIPNLWEVGGPFPLYYEFGFVAFLSACALYPESVGKIWWSRGVTARERAKILVRLYREFDFVPMMFCGEDICNNQGPMVRPDMLRQHYWPVVKSIIEPLVDAGIRVLHHCDGDVRPIVGDMIASGFSGFQGFQYETGVDLYGLRRLRSLRGEEPILWTGMSVTRTLPFGTPDDVRAEVDYFLDATDGGRGMFLFTSNVSGVEVPPDNLRAGYAHVRAWNPRQSRKPAHARWPWTTTHPE